MSASEVRSSQPWLAGNVNRLPPNRVVPQTSQYSISNTLCGLAVSLQRMRESRNNWPVWRLPTISSVAQLHPGLVHAHSPSMFLKNQWSLNVGSDGLCPHRSRAIRRPRAASIASASPHSSPNNLRENSESRVALVMFPSKQAASILAPVLSPLSPSASSRLASSEVWELSSAWSNVLAMMAGSVVP